MNDLKVVETRVNQGGMKIMKKTQVVIETRADGSIRVVGYVNKIGSASRPFTLNGHTVVERIMKGAFAGALRKAHDIKVNIDHDDSRVIARTGDGTASFYEDEIGLHADVVITDQNVIKAIAEDKFAGWSFKFHSTEDKTYSNNGIVERYVRSMELIDVSMIFDRIPLYPATSAYMYTPNGRQKDIIKKRQNNDRPAYSFKKEQAAYQNADLRRRLNEINALKLRSYKMKADALRK